MSGGRIILLCLLLIVLAAVVYTQVVPRREMLQHNIAQATGVDLPTPTPAPAGDIFSKAAVLADGSFNPIPTTKSKPTDAPAKLVASDPWRARYAPIMERLAGPQDRPGFYVYSFLDRTPQGMGLTCTYGWHLFGEAALARWSDARLAGGERPQHFGLPEVDPEHPGELPTAAQWNQRALADPATQQARYIVVGVYDFDAATKQNQLEIHVLDRNAASDSKGTMLFSGESPGPDKFQSLAEAQRQTARALARKLIDIGIAKPRPTFAAHGLILDNELRAVAQLFDANDTWAVMDGVDRALDLSVIFPESTAPLQAAVYGMNELSWTWGKHAREEPDALQDWLLRDFSLAQIAQAIDPKPAMTQFNSLAPVIWTGIPMQALGATELTTSTPELRAYRAVLLSLHLPNERLEGVDRLPDWFVLCLESQQTWYIGRSDYRYYFQDRAPHWESNDLFFQSQLYAAMDSRYIKGVYDVYERQGEMSRVANRQAFSSEWAAVMSTIAQDSTSTALLNLTSAFMALDPKAAATAAEKRDYYALRSLALESTKTWDEPSQPSHPSYRMIAALQPVIQSAYANAKMNEASSGFQGFEFTPAARLRWAQRNDYLGAYYKAKKEGLFAGSYNALVQLSGNYVQARKDSAEAYNGTLDLLKNSVQGDTWKQQLQMAAKNLNDLSPLKSESYVDLARAYFGFDQPQLGLPYLAALARLDPPNPFNDLALGRSYRGNGVNDKAAEYLQKFITTYPLRYDIQQEWAWAMCSMGHSKEDKIRAIFADPVMKLAGNSSFHTNNLDYLIYWDKDYVKARYMALFYAKTIPGNASLEYQYRVEVADGKTSAALGFLAQMTDDKKYNADIQRFHAQLAMKYLDCDRKDLAQPHIAIASELPNEGIVMEALGQYAFANGDYPGALKQYESCLKSFGFDPWLVGRVGAALDKLGKADEALQRMETEFAGANNVSRMALVPQMLSLLARKKDIKKMDTYFNLLLRSKARDRGVISDSLDAYRTLDKKFADEVWSHVDSIMAAPGVYSPPAHESVSANLGGTSGGN